MHMAVGPPVALHRIDMASGYLLSHTISFLMTGCLWAHPCGHATCVR